MFMNGSRKTPLPSQQVQYGLAAKKSSGSEDIFCRTLTRRTLYLDVVAGPGGNVLDLQRGADCTTPLAVGMAKRLNASLVVPTHERRTIGGIPTRPITGRDVMGCDRELEQSPSLIDPDPANEIRSEGS